MTSNHVSDGKQEEIKKSDGDEITGTPDQFGFITNQTDQHKKSEISKAKVKQLNERQQKWRQMIDEKNFIEKVHKLDNKIKRRVRKGIPQGIRQKVWPLLAEVESYQSTANLDYNQLVECKDFPYKNDIQVDLPRTFPNHLLFKGNDSLGLKSLNNILKALSLSFKEMGYCQGINFIAASLLMYLNDEQAFWMLYSLMKKYDCLSIYQNVANVYIHLDAFDKLLNKFMPEVYKKLNKFNIQSVFYATPWFMTLFSAVLPFNLYVRVFDIFLLEKWKIIFRVGLTIIKYQEQAILKAESFDDVMVALKQCDVFNKVDEDEFFNKAMKSFVFSKKKITKYEEEYQKKNKPEDVVNRPNN